MHHDQSIELHHEIIEVAEHGSAEPLLLLHGFGGSGADWVHAGLDELARRHRLIVADLRGHGRSPDPAPPLTMRACAGDVLALLDCLGVSRCKAIGVSMGGNVLLHVATRAPDRISAMVLVSATPYFPEQARAIMRQDPRARATFAERHDDMAFTPPLLATIAARTLLLQGDRDPLYPVSLSVEMYQAIPRAALCVVPDAGHAPVFSDAAPRFVETALAFLAGGAAD
jgi:pimeloyl-ACP methyl ester carboxylesterase